MKGTVERYGPTWRIRYEAGIKPDGRRDQRSKGGYPTRKTAEAALSEIMEKIRVGTYVDTGRLTVGAYLDQWLAGKVSLRPSTARSYESHIRVYLKAHLGSVPFASLRADHLDVMYGAIRSQTRPPSAATLRRVHATLHSALQAAVRRRLLPFNPADQVELEVAPRPERDVWTPSQVAAFLAATQDDRLSALYRFAAMTGLRRGELCGLRWEDVDLAASTATISQTVTDVGGQLVFGPPKTKRGARTIALDAETVHALRSHRAGQAQERLAWAGAYQDHGLLFAREDGAPLRPEYVTRHFQHLAERAGLPVIVLHGLRHSHATHALAAGVPAKVVSDRLGHSSITLTLDTYTRTMLSVDRSAADLVAALVKASGATT